jgi:magnesium-transporting ATPase (P-type)
VTNVEVDQSILTGESVTVGKEVKAIAENKNTVIQDKTNVLFKV